MKQNTERDENPTVENEGQHINPAPLSGRSIEGTVDNIFDTTNKRNSQIENDYEDQKQVLIQTSAAQIMPSHTYGFDNMEGSKNKKVLGKNEIYIPPDSRESSKRSGSAELGTRKSVLGGNSKQFASKLQKIQQQQTTHLGQYKSRKDKVYVDNVSDDSDFEDSEEEEQQASETVEKVGILKSNPIFKNYKSMFQNFLDGTRIKTKFPVVNCQITYDSSKAVTIMQESDQVYWVKMYDLDTYENTFSEKFEGVYIKFNEVSQNSYGNKFAVAYINDGNFKIRTFGKQNRTHDDIQANEFDVNKALGIDDNTIPNQGNADPYIVSSFLNDDRLFVALFHNSTLTHYHFVYDIKNQKVEDKIVQIEMKNSSTENYPVQCFYNTTADEAYVFYRQGQAYVIAQSDIGNYSYEKMTDYDLGQMFLFNNQALIVKSSSQILFFRIETGEFKGTREWKLYHKLEQRGFIFYIKGNKRIQVTTEDKIFFYVINNQTYLPELENTMNNFMKCTQMMFGSKVRYCITFKNNQPDFEIYKRKYEHNFKSLMHDENLNRSQCLEIPSTKSFLVSKKNNIRVFDSLTFLVRGSFDVDIPESFTREQNQIISMETCQNNIYLAVVSGKRLIMSEQQPNQLDIFKRNGDEYEHIYKIDLQEIEEFSKVCMTFFFKIQEGSKRDSLIFSKIDQIFELNFETKELKTIYRYTGSERLSRQPQYFQIDDTQKIMITASAVNGIYINLVDNFCIDIDSEFKISKIKEVVFDKEDQSFYLLFNQHKQKLGIYLAKVYKLDPYQNSFLVRWQTMLEIGDCNIFIMRNETNNYKEIVVSYCTIYMNTHSVIVMDMTSENKGAMIFRHESFQLWEQDIKGMLLSDSKDFLTISMKGISVLALGTWDKRAIKTQYGRSVMVHSLDSYNHLKLAPENYLVFYCNDEDQQYISVEQEFLIENQAGDKSNVFEEIYNIKFTPMSLRHLLLMKSIYMCQTNNQIIDLVNDQPEPTVFYDSAFELDGSNMASVLSFDSRSMDYLLDEKFESFFKTETPIFYKQKIQKGKIVHYDDVSQYHINNKYFYRSAIDNSLRNNQIHAVHLMIQYIQKYQNNYSSFFLFQNNLKTIIQKRIAVQDLLDSDVFRFRIDFPEWPQIHTDCESYLRPYAGSIFDIRAQYRKVFYESRFAPISLDEEDDQNDNESIGSSLLSLIKNKKDSNRVYKIQYSLSLLPQCGTHIMKSEDGKMQYFNTDVSIMDLVTHTEEFDIFLSSAVQDYINFKWLTFGKSWHLQGCFAHFNYITILIIYNTRVYIYNDVEYRLVPDHPDGGGDFNQKTVVIYAVLLGIGILYAFIYDLSQIIRLGVIDYYSDPWNFIDSMYIVVSISQVVLHIILGPFAIVCKMTMILVVWVAMMKTFFFLRILDALSPIVTMLQRVTVDLSVFLLFFIILIIGFSVLLDVLTLGNINIPGQFRSKFEEDIENLAYPGAEFSRIGLFTGNILKVFKAAVGDYSLINSSLYLTDIENMLFWLIFFGILVFTNIIFLNFVIAEAGNSYSIINEQIGQHILKNKAIMIDEAEEMLPHWKRSEFYYPKFIVTRKLDQ